MAFRVHLDPIYVDARERGNVIATPGLHEGNRVEIKFLFRGYIKHKILIIWNVQSSRNSHGVHIKVLPLMLILA